MTHWGWYWKVKKKHISRILCSKLPSIDSFKLAKFNDMRAGFWIDPIMVKATIEDNHFKITYRNRKDIAYTIPIDKQPCNYGGFRYFFRCPLCQKRMRFLYFSGQSLFLCRKCLNLCHDSQRLRPTRRYDYMSRKVKSLIKEKGGDLDNYTKPPRMHKETYQRLRSKEFYYQDKSHQALNKELREWFGERVKSYLDGFFDYVDENKEWKQKIVNNKSKSM